MLRQLILVAAGFLLCGCDSPQTQPDRSPRSGGPPREHTQAVAAEARDHGSVALIVAEGLQPVSGGAPTPAQSAVAGGALGLAAANSLKQHASRVRCLVSPLKLKHLHS